MTAILHKVYLFKFRYFVKESWSNKRTLFEAFVCQFVNRSSWSKGTHSCINKHLKLGSRMKHFENQKHFWFRAIVTDLGRVDRCNSSEIYYVMILIGSLFTKCKIFISSFIEGQKNGQSRNNCLTLWIGAITFDCFNSWIVLTKLQWPEPPWATTSLSDHLS